MLLDFSSLSKPFLSVPLNKKSLPFLLVSFLLTGGKSGLHLLSPFQTEHFRDCQSSVLSWKKVLLGSVIVSYYKDQTQSALEHGCFLSFSPPACPGQKANRKHPFLKGIHVTSRRGRSVGKLPTHAVCIFPHPAPLCFS